MLNDKQLQTDKQINSSIYPTSFSPVLNMFIDDYSLLSIVMTRPKQVKQIKIIQNNNIIKAIS